MRDIKFRLWLKNNEDDPKGTMYYNCLPLGGWDKWWVNLLGDENEGMDGEFDVGKDCDIMQFTGIKDKNGKEIYEGDICKIHNLKISFRNEPSHDWRIVEIVWNKYTWTFHNSDLSMPLSDYDTKDLAPYDIEVIGNIYENPELLKQLNNESKNS